MPALDTDRAHTRALLNADLEGLLVWHRILCDDLTVLSRSPDLSVAMLDQLSAVAGTLTAGVLTLRELIDQVDGTVS